MLTPREVLPLAVQTAILSPCQSKRGAVIWGEEGVVATGFNHQPPPFHCDGSDECRSACSKTAVHAEQAALLGTIIPPNAHMMHIKVINGDPVPSSGPSCVPCSKLILASGIVVMWLLLPKRWKSYGTEYFHYKSCGANSISLLRSGVRMKPHVK